MVQNLCERYRQIPLKILIIVIKCFWESTKKYETTSITNCIKINNSNFNCFAGYVNGLNHLKHKSIYQHIA